MTILGPLQCWCGKDWDLHRSLQTVERLQGKFKNTNRKYKKIQIHKQKLWKDYQANTNTKHKYTNMNCDKTIRQRPISNHHHPRFLHQNPNVTSLAILPTVVELRQQRYLILTLGRKTRHDLSIISGHRWYSGPNSTATWRNVSGYSAYCSLQNNFSLCLITQFMLILSNCMHLKLG